MDIRSFCLRLAILYLVVCSIAAAQSADLILYDGKIVTVDPQFRIVDSIAIRGDRIVSTGTHAETNKFAGPNTRQMDLKGKTARPGLMDTHVHSSDASIYEFDHPVPDMETIADVLHYIESRAAVAKKGEWIVLTRSFYRCR